jgi:hypothetical protein
MTKSYDHETYGRNYRLFAEIDHEGTDIHVLWHTETEHRVLLERSLGSIDAANSLAFYETTRYEVSNTCDEFRIVGGKRFVWFLTVSVKVMDNEEPHSREVVNGGV